MSDLSTFFKAIKDSFPVIEFMGAKFRVRVLSPSDRMQALADLRAASKEMAFSKNDQPYDEDKMAQAIQSFSGGSEEIKALFEMGGFKTQGDLDRVIYIVGFAPSYAMAAALSMEDGSNIGLDDRMELANVIHTNSKFRNLISEALAPLNAEPEKNGHSPSEKLSQSPN